VQLATPTRVAVVDAMADVNLDPVWRLVADERVKKVLHAGQQDLEPVVRHLGVAPANIFDTQVVCGFCALPYPLSLRRLLEATVGVRLPKALTFTSWDERPMSAGHLRYAADDVRYLHAVHADLTDRLRRLGHEPFAEAACRELCGTEGYRFNPIEAALRVRGGKGLPADLFSVLVALVALRDEGARESDVPPRSFLRDEVLIGLARRPPKDRSQLEGWRDLPRPVVERYGKRIIDAVAEARKKPMQPPGVDPDAVEESAGAAFRADGFWAAVQAACLGRGVDPSVVLARSGAVSFLRELDGKGPEQAIDSLGGWRGDLLRPMLRQWLAGERSLELKWAGDGLRMA
jgi:ribonuclease D